MLIVHIHHLSLYPQFVQKESSSLIKAPNSWISENKYFEQTQLYDRATEFADEAQGDSWYVGYASDTLQTGKELECYVGGSLSVSKKLATEVWDDQRVRTMAISDGRGITVFVSLDAFGLAGSEVNKIRDMLADYSELYLEAQPVDILTYLRLVYELVCLMYPNNAPRPCLRKQIAIVLLHYSVCS